MKRSVPFLDACSTDARVDQPPPPSSSATNRGIPIFLFSFFSLDWPLSIPLILGIRDQGSEGYNSIGVDCDVQTTYIYIHHSICWGRVLVERSQPMNAPAVGSVYYGIRTDTGRGGVRGAQLPRIGIYSFLPRVSLTGYPRG